MNLGRWVMTPAQIQQAGGKKGLDVVWREKEMINGHILLAGGSGTGKTHNIRKIVNMMRTSARQDIRVHVFDVHDDIDIPGCSDVLFSESSDTGLNPLKIEPDRHSGGVRKAISNFIDTLNKTSRKIGDRQEAVLRNLLEELYAANGFYADKPDTWTLESKKSNGYAKKFPNVDDLYRYTAFKYRQMFTGGDGEACAKLDDVNKAANAIHRTVKERVTKESEEALEKQKVKAIEAYSDYVNAIEVGKEMDELIKYDSKTVLKSVLDRISNLKNCGIFKNTAPDFDYSNPVWRYRIKHLGSDEKKMFVLFKLKELYDDALRRGEQDDIVEVIVIDESSKFMDSDPDNIISIMANEIRKFGTSLVCASQAFTHFSDDFLASVATKMILGIDELYHDKTCRQLQLKRDWLNWISPRRSALISMKRNLPPNHPAAKTKWFFTQFV